MPWISSFSLISINTFHRQEWTNTQIKDHSDEHPFQEENAMWSVHYSWRNFLLYEKNPDPLNEICTKSIGFEDWKEEMVFNWGSGFSKSAENKIASISFSALNSRISLTRRFASQNIAVTYIGYLIMVNIKLLYDYFKPGCYSFGCNLVSTFIRNIGIQFLRYRLSLLFFPKQS